ncbi:MAG: nucleotidyltransferase domain-containing protein [Nitrospiraceae bacterium]
MHPTASPQLTDIERRIKDVLAHHPSIVMAFVFGSLATGHARSDSDLDVAILATTPLASQAHIELIEDLALAFGRPVDLLDLSETHGPLLQQILTRGRMIFCKDRSRYAALLLRMLYEEADYMPYYRRILAERRRAWIGT